MQGTCGEGRERVGVGEVREGRMARGKLAGKPLGVWIGVGVEGRGGVLRRGGVMVMVMVPAALGWCPLLTVVTVIEEGARGASVAVPVALG